MKCMRSLRAGTYQVKLCSMESVRSSKDTPGLKLLLLVADPDHGGAERIKQMRAYGYKADELIESVCDQFKREFEDENKLAAYWKEHEVTGVFSTNDAGYEEWAF